MIRRAAWLLLLGLAACAGPSASARVGPPNVLLILADDLGYSDLGCYGGEIATPNLDALAAGGLRFTQFYNTARCWPTRASLLSGWYAQQVRRDTVPGIPSGGRGVRPAWAKLLPELLKPQGYRSYHSGKWHVDGAVLASGFDRSYRLEDAGRYFSPQNHSLDDARLPAIGRGSGYYTTTAVADRAISFLREHAERHRGRPFFQYLAFTAPHFPLHAPPEDIARYRDRYREGWEAVRERRVARIREFGIFGGAAAPFEREVGPPYPFPEAIRKLGEGEVNRPLPWAELTEAQRGFQAAKMEVHAAMVDRMDREIGRVLDQLRAMGSFEDTLLLFLSDNGASAEIMVRDDGHDPAAPPGSAGSHLCLGPGWSTACNAPWRRHKTWVHEGGISTPLVAHWPRGIAARGELRRSPGHVIDVVPTLLELAGGKPPEGAPGRSFVRAFAGETGARDELWWQHEGNRALRSGDWKIVAAGAKAAWELYDLAADRGETADLAAKHPEKVRALAELWERRRDDYYALARRDLK